MDAETLNNCFEDAGTMHNPGRAYTLERHFQGVDSELPYASHPLGEISTRRWKLATFC